MPVVAAENSTSSEHHLRYRKPRNQNQSFISLDTDPNHPTPQMPPPPPPTILSSSSRCKSTISSLLISTFHPTTTTNDTTTTTKKKTFTTFRGLGCTASSQVSVPATIRQSANWEGKKVKKMKKKKHGRDKNKGPPNSAVDNNNNTSTCVAVVPDVWCGPGIGFTTDAASVDCVVSRRPVSGRGKVDVEKMLNQRERPSYATRRMVTPEDFSFFEPDSTFGMPRSRLDVLGSRHHRHVRHPSPEGLAEIVMLQSSLMMGGRSDGLDNYRDLRLDVDNMSYEELLELGDRIGYVNTGLREDDIISCLRKTKISIPGDLSTHSPTEMERKCSICQEEYETDDEMGKLYCGHFYHILCIKQWLAQKNTCPICKTAAISQC